MAGPCAMTPALLSVYSYRRFLEETVMRAAIVLALMLAMTPVVLLAQKNQDQKPDANPVTTTVRKIMERQSKNMVGAAEEMPADKYSYKPTADQMTFGHLIVHIVEANNTFCSAIGGEAKPPEEKLAETDSKDKLVQALRNSFDTCNGALSKTDDSKLGEEVTVFGSKRPRAAAMIGLATAFADHYAAQAMYLRLNGLMPPTAKERHEAKPAEKK